MTVLRPCRNPSCDNGLIKYTEAGKVRTRTCDVCGGTGSVEVASDEEMEELDKGESGGPR